jgi:hypothetical protein
MAERPFREMKQAETADAFAYDFYEFSDCSTALSRSRALVRNIKVTAT